MPLFVDYGVVAFSIFAMLISVVYRMSYRNVKYFASARDYLMHYFLLYSVVFMMFVGGGVFSVLPFIFSSAYIASSYNTYSRVIVSRF